jgi:hypothetical protein
MTPDGMLVPRFIACVAGFQFLRFLSEFTSAFALIEMKYILVPARSRDTREYPLPSPVSLGPQQRQAETR